MINMATHPMIIVKVKVDTQVVIRKINITADTQIKKVIILRVTLTNQVVVPKVRNLVIRWITVIHIGVRRNIPAVDLTVRT